MISSNTLLTLAKFTFGASATGIAIVAGGLWFFQRHIIYPSYVPQGSREAVPRPIEVGCPYEDITLTCPDGVKIKAYVVPARRKPLTAEDLRGLSKEQRKEKAKGEMEDWMKEMGDETAIEYAKSRPTVVIFHANAGNMGHRIPLARSFNVNHGCNVFMLSYRGYGLSEGRPSEHGLKIDIQTAMEYVKAHPILGATNIVLYGQSLGGSAALYAASKHGDAISGVIVENTFLSLQSLIPLVLPQIPKLALPILLTEHWDAHQTMPLISLSTPVLFLAGKNDTLVKPTQMKALRELRGKKGRTRWREFEGEHNDTCIQPGYWEEIGKWLKEEVEDYGVQVLDTEAEDEFSEVTAERVMEEKKTV